MRTHTHVFKMRLLSLCLSLSPLSTLPIGLSVRPCLPLCLRHSLSVPLKCLLQQNTHTAKEEKQARRTSPTCPHGTARGSSDLPLIHLSGSVDPTRPPKHTPTAKMRMPEHTNNVTVSCLHFSLSSLCLLFKKKSILGDKNPRSSSIFRHDP